MRTRVAAIAATLLTGVSLVAWGLTVREQRDPTVILHTPDGAVTDMTACKTGCNAPTEDETHTLSTEEFLELLDQVNAEPLGAASLAAETLMFHFEEAAPLLDAYGDRLDPAKRDWLATELSRTTAQVSFRLLANADGRMLGEVSQLVPLKTKQHLVLDMADQYVEVSGKIKRVGLHHLWTRW